MENHVSDIEDTSNWIPISGMFYILILYVYMHGRPVWITKGFSIHFSYLSSVDNRLEFAKELEQLKMLNLLLLYKPLLNKYFFLLFMQILFFSIVFPKMLHKNMMNTNIKM